MKRKRQSLQQKLAIVFTVIIIFIIIFSLFLYKEAADTIRQETYEKMSVQAEYYQEILEMEVENGLTQQLEFFNNRRLVFLAKPNTGLSVYEERESVLDVRERIWIITESNSLIQGGILYIPGTEYRITSTSIDRMTPSDLDDMEYYLQSAGEELHFDGENFYSVRNNMNFIFVIFYSSRKIVDNLSLFNTSTNSGSFIYHESGDVMLESSSSEVAGRMIWDHLVRDEQGNYERVQRVRLGSECYLVFVGEQGRLGTFVQYIEEASLMEKINMFWRYALLVLSLIIVLSVIFVLYTRKAIRNPLNILVQACEKLKEGNLKEHIYHNNQDEFSYLYQAFNDMEDRLSQLIDEVYVQKNLTSYAQMKQLQAQINPHFLYNSFFLLRRRIKRQDYEGAEEIAGHLGEYFKYLTRDGSDFLPLKQEIEHAKSYAAIQQARFAGRVRVEFGQLPLEAENIIVPRLIVQPLLENAFGYGLENKVSDGVLRVSFQRKENMFFIYVEDNGEEAGDENIADMQISLEEANPVEITGMINIHRRLKTCFQGNGGLRIDRSGLGGVAITICIPMTEK